MKTELDAYTVAPGETIRDAMAAINENAEGIVLVVVEDKLVGTVTDGDIRRGILRGASLDAVVENVMNDSPHVASTSISESEAVRVMKQNRFRHLPVVGPENTLAGLICLSEFIEHLDQPRTETLAAVIMAGGLGKRLRPYTEDTPKPLIEVGGKPILEHIVEHLARHDVREIYVTTRYLAEQIEDYFGDGSPWGVRVEYVRETKRLGTAGGLKALEDKLQSRFLVMNGDLLTDFNVRQISEFHAEQEALMTMGVRHFEMQVPYGVVEVDGPRITRLDEKPNLEFFVNAGIYVMEPELLERIPADEQFDISVLIEELLIEQLPVVRFPIIEQWIDIGRPEDLERASARLEARRVTQ